MLANLNIFLIACFLAPHSMFLKHLIFEELSFEFVLFGASNKYPTFMIN